MGKPVFDKKMFLEQNKIAKDNDFPDIATGYYLVRLDKCYEGYAKSGSGNFNVYFAWKIDAEDENHANQYIWQTIKLGDSTESNEMGYKILAIILSMLGYDIDVHGSDLEVVYERLIDTIVRLQYTAGTDDKPFANIKIKSVINSTLENPSEVKNFEEDDDELDVADPEPYKDTVTKQTEADIQPGDYIWLHDARVVKVVGLMPSDDPNNQIGEDHLMVHQAHKSPTDIEIIYPKDCQNKLSKEVGDKVAGSTRYNFQHASEFDNLMNDANKNVTAPRSQAYSSKNTPPPKGLVSEEEEEVEEEEIEEEEAWSPAVGDTVMGKNKAGDHYIGDIKELLDGGKVKVRARKNKAGKILVYTTHCDNLKLNP